MYICHLDARKNPWIFYCCLQRSVYVFRQSLFTWVHSNFLLFRGVDPFMLTLSSQSKKISDAWNEFGSTVHGFFLVFFFSSRIGTQILFFSFPNPQRTNTCFLWLLAALENTNRLRKKASSMHLFVEIYPRTFAGTSWKFRDP